MYDPLKELRTNLRVKDQHGELSDADREQWLDATGGAMPCSRYGRHSDSVTDFALALDRFLSQETGESQTLDTLDLVMSLIVNDSPEPSYLVQEYGYDPLLAPYVDWINDIEGENQ